MTADEHLVVLRARVGRSAKIKLTIHGYIWRLSVDGHEVEGRSMLSAFSKMNAKLYKEGLIK